MPQCSVRVCSRRASDAAGAVEARTEHGVGYASCVNSLAAPLRREEEPYVRFSRPVPMGTDHHAFDHQNFLLARGRHFVVVWSLRHRLRPHLIALISLGVLFWIVAILIVAVILL